MKAGVLRAVPAMPLALFLVVAFFIPTITTVLLGLWDPARGFDLAGLVTLATKPVYLNVLARSLEIAAWTTVLCVLGGFPIAVAIHAAAGRWKRMLLVAVLIPFWTSALVKGFAWAVLLGKNGAVNALLSGAAGSRVETGVLYTHAAVVLGMVHTLMPFAVISILPVLEALDVRLEQAARTLGAGRFETLLRVVLPLAKPGIASASLIVLITALGFFIIPALLGGPRQMMVANVIIESVQEVMNWKLAGVLALILFSLVAVLLLVYGAVFGMGSLIGEQRAWLAGAGRQRRRRLWSPLRRHFWRSVDAIGALAARVPGSRWVARHGGAVTVGLLLLFLLAPVLVLVPVSFTRSAIVDWPPEFLSGRWYQALLSPNWIAATTRSLVVAFFSSLLAISLALPAAIWFVRHAGRWRSASLLAVISPLIIPRIILAVGLFWLYARLGLVGSHLGLVIGHAVIAVPFVTLTLISVIQAYDERLDAAAAICGAAPLERTRRITLPILAPGLVSAFLFACVTSIDELTIALFVTGGLTNTLPKQMWDEAAIKVTPTLASASVVLFLVMALVVLAGERLRAPSSHR